MKKINIPRFNGGFLSFSNKVFFVFLIAVSLLFIACEEEGLLGLDFIGHEAGVYKTDTLSITAITQKEDSIPSNDVRMAVIGLMNDPVYGKSKSSFYSEVRLIENDISIGNEPRLDSIVLRLAYSDFYGDTLTRQVLRVYELTERIPEDTIIYSNRTVPHKAEPIVTKSIMPKPNDSIVIGGVLRVPQIRINLGEEFGNRIIEQNGTESFENNANFLDFFNGLYITVEDHDRVGGVGYFDITNPITGIMLYYTDLDSDDDDDNNDDQSLTQFFPINMFCRRYNHFENFDYQNISPVISGQIHEDNTSLGDSIVFLKGLHGLRAKINIHDLEGFGDDKNIVVNKASLIIPVDESFSSAFFPAPSSLIMFALDSNGELKSIIDSYLGSAIYGGSYNDEEKHYKFNITRHVQSIINGSFDTGQIVIRANNPMENAHRVALKGPGRTDENIRLELIYSVFD